MPASLRVHVVGAGPVGLMLTALLQSVEGVSVRLYEQRREYDHSKLRMMEQYAQTTGCRREFILSYFGESYPHANCGGCDNCGPEPKQR